MASDTVTTVTIFDQHDIELIAQQQLQRILTRVDQDRMNLMIRIGRKLIDQSPITHQERVQLYTAMMLLRFDGVILIPASLMSHNTGRVQVYEQICRQVFAAVSAS